MDLNDKSQKPTLLILGARGFLGSAVSALAAPSFHLLRADRDRDDAQTDLVVDITNKEQVASALRAARPDHVLLLAAISDIDRCERDPVLATEVNLYGAEYVANTCAQIGARLLFTSTGAVFDGKKIGYLESDPPSPTSVYARTKAEAEQLVLSLLPSAIVLRVSLVLGRAANPNTNSLLDSLIRRWSRGEITPASTIESRNPIDALTLSTWLLELLSNPSASGIIHAGSLQAATRYEIALAIAKELGVSPALVKPESAPPPNRAPRGAHQHLLSNRLPQLCNTAIPTLDAVIKRSLHEIT